MSEVNYVAGLALNWSRIDPTERWVDAAPQGGPRPVEEKVLEYLGTHNPFPNDYAVEVMRRDAAGWEPARIVERVGLDEWTVEFLDGEQAWRDHHELRPGLNMPEQPPATEGPK